MPPKSQSEVVDIDVQIKLGDREKAWLVVSLTTNKEAWVPKSLGEIEMHSKGFGMATLTIPSWLAEEKELV